MLTPEQKQKLLSKGYSVTQVNTFEKKKESGAFGAKEMPSDFEQDIRETLSGLKSVVDERTTKIGEIEQARKQKEQGILRSFLQKVGQGAGAVSDIIGQSVVGIGKAVLPQEAEEKIKEVATKGAEFVVKQEPVQNLLQKYESLKQTNPQLARDIDSALGFTQLALDVGTAGIGGQVVKTGIKTGLKGADLVGTGIKKTTGLVGRAGAEVEGALTGTSAETIQQAFNASYRGGEELTKFTSALRNKLTPEQLVENVRQSTDLISASKTKNFSDMIENIGDSVVDTSKVQTSVISKLKEFGIDVKDNGELDFAKSKFRTIPQAQTKLQTMFNEVSNIGDTQPLRQVDTTRQALKELLLTGDDSSARSANALINTAVDEVRTAGRTVDGYGKALDDFAEDADFLNELSRSLASGDKNTIDTAYRRIATALKTNNERRMQLVKELDDATGGYILSDIAGQQLSEVLPRGLFRQIAAGIAGAGIVTGGISQGIIPALIFASPRITGEFVRALGITAKKADIIIDAVDRARKVLENANIKLPVVSPIKEGITPEQQEQ